MHENDFPSASVWADNDWIFTFGWTAPLNCVYQTKSEGETLKIYVSPALTLTSREGNLVEKIGNNNTGENQEAGRWVWWQRGCEGRNEGTKDRVDERVVSPRLAGSLCVVELMTGIKEPGGLLGSPGSVRLQPSPPSLHPRRPAGIWLHLA